MNATAAGEGPAKPTAGAAWSNLSLLVRQVHMFTGRGFRATDPGVNFSLKKPTAFQSTFRVPTTAPSCVRRR
jgi:hypothetical protein